MLDKNFIKQQINIPSIYLLIGNLTMIEALFYLLIFILLLFNQGSILLSIPYTNLPLAESIILITFLYYLIFDRVFLISIQKNIFFIPIFLLFIQVIIGAILNFNQYGIYSFRTGTHFYDIMAFFIGLKFAQKLSTKIIWYRLFKIILSSVSIYYLTIPFRYILLPLSPVVTNLSGASVNFLWNYGYHGVLVMTNLALILYRKSKNLFNLNSLIAIFAVFFALFIEQRRQNYFFFFILISIFYFFKRKTFKISNSIFLIAIILISFLLINSIGFESRYTDGISFDFIKQNILSSFDFSNIQDAYNSDNYDPSSGYREGASLRLYWWLNIFSRLIQNPLNLIFGLGQGVPLTDFNTRYGAQIFEPHNSYISVIGRLGLFGFISFIYIQFNFFKILLKKIKDEVNEKVRDNYLVMLFFFSATTFNSFVQDAFEKPYYAIPYYFFWGIILNYKNKNNIDNYE